CVQRLKSDLDLITVPVVPWADEGGAAGYFEIREGLPSGSASDTDVNGNGLPDAEFEPGIFNLAGSNQASASNLLGDTDDWLGMTIRAAGVPFTGQAFVPGVN